jgi:phosphatidylglycerol:prolipoprotein diacylglycerol transferase
VVIGIDPVIFSVGPVAVRWFGLLTLLGLGVAIRLSLRELERQKLGRTAALDALAWALPAGIVTARVVQVLAYWDYYLTRPAELWQLNLNGLSLWGGLVGGGLIAAARLKPDPRRRRRILDVIVPYVALGVAVGRVGAFLDGRGQGLPSTLPWATQYANRLAVTPDFGVPRHPAQLYDALLALGLFLVLSILPRGLPAGSRLATFLVGYGGARVVLGLVRLDPPFLFGLQIEQLLAIGSIAVGTLVGLSPLLRGARSAAASRAETREATRAGAKEDSVAA